MSGTRPPVFVFRDARQPLPCPHTHPCFRDDLARLRPRRTPFASDHVGPAPFAPARLRHFRPAHWKRRRRQRRRGGRGEEGAAREARRGGALRAPWDLGRSAPPRPGVAGSPGRSGERRGRCRRGVRTWRQPGRGFLAVPPSPREPTPAVPGQPLRALPASELRKASPPKSRRCPCRLPALPTSQLS